MQFIPGKPRLLLILFLVASILLVPSRTTDYRAFPGLGLVISPLRAAAQGGETLYLPFLAKGTSYACTPDPVWESENVWDAPEICSYQQVTGTVDWLDLDDVFKIWVEGGQTIYIAMSGYGGDADLYLYPPDTTDINDNYFVASSTSFENNEEINYNAYLSGYWYISVYESEHSTGTYTGYTLTAIVY